MNPDDLFRIVDVTGVIANALIGSALARALKYDLIGYLVLGIGTALGGGMVRDMLLGIGFPVALTDPWYLGGAVGASIFSYFFTFEGRWSSRALSVADVLALGCWSATGASKGLSAGLGWIPSIFLGIITATMGGLLRDVIANRVPAIFGGNPLFATFAVLGATQMVVFQSLGLYEWGMGSAILICALFGLLARHFNWQLPRNAYNLNQYSTRLRQLRIGKRTSDLKKDSHISANPAKEARQRGRDHRRDSEREHRREAE